MTTTSNGNIMADEVASSSAANAETESQLENGSPSAATVQEADAPSASTTVDAQLQSAEATAATSATTAPTTPPPPTPTPVPTATPSPPGTAVPPAAPQAHPQRARNARDRVFYALFVRLALTYARCVPPRIRRVIEFIILIKAIVFLITLIYVHTVFATHPATCLDFIKDDWPKEGVLRVLVPQATTYEALERVRREAMARDIRRSTRWIVPTTFGQSLKNDTTFYSPSQILRKSTNLISDLRLLHVYKTRRFEPLLTPGQITLVEVEVDHVEHEDEGLWDILTALVHIFIDPVDAMNKKKVLAHEEHQEVEEENVEVVMPAVTEPEVPTEPLAPVPPTEPENPFPPESPVDPTFDIMGTADGEKFSPPLPPVEETGTPDVTDTTSMSNEEVKTSVEINETVENAVAKIEAQEQKERENAEYAEIFGAHIPGYEYAIEYSLEYGLLRLGKDMREKLNINVVTVILDPRNDACFGDNFSRFILNEFIGYEDVVMTSVKALAKDLPQKGFLRDLVTGEHYRFVASWPSRTSYFAAFLIMIVFTFATSMLLRFSHHQIFLFIVDLLQMFELNVAIAFPAAPLLTVILALVGMEAIMSEFFNDTSTAFYVILMVWIGDQYDAVCCNTPISRRHWLRFFYLYHFAFYAYHYRFNGMYSGLALLTSWLFIQHSMIYFVNHYELPHILHEFRVQRLLESGVVRNINAARQLAQANGTAAPTTAGQPASATAPADQSATSTAASVSHTVAETVATTVASSVTIDSTTEAAGTSTTTAPAPMVEADEPSLD